MSQQLLDMYNALACCQARPDQFALQRLDALALKWKGSVDYVCHELRANLVGVTEVHQDRGVYVDVHASPHERDAHGFRAYVVRPSNRVCHLRVQEPGKHSQALMSICKRWEDKFAEESKAAPGQPLQPLPPQQQLKRPRDTGLQAGLAPPALRPPTCVYAAPAAAWGIATEEDLRDAAGELAPYDVRFRLLAAGALDLFRSDRKGLRQLCDELAKAVRDERPPKELNAIARRHNISLGFSTPPEGRAIVYQIDVPLNHYSESAPIKLRMPTEQGSSVAHRRFKDELLRVHFEPLPEDANDAQKSQRKFLKRHLLEVGIYVAGRVFYHFVHKDTEKDEKQSALWYIAIRRAKTNPIRWQKLATCRDLLLDSQAWDKGKEAKGKLTASKLNARLTLAFSQTVHVRRCTPNVAHVEDYRGSLMSWKDLQMLPPLYDGMVKMVIIDDVKGLDPHGGVAVDPTGDDYLMTDGAGMISHNLAMHIPACTSGRLLFDTDSAESTEGDIPLQCQVRVWHRGYVAKGMLLADSTLPPGYIVLRESMVKVFGRTECLLNKDDAVRPTDEQSAFEVIRTSNFAPEASLNSQLVPLLECGGGDRVPGDDNHERMVQLLLKLQDISVQKICELGKAENLTAKQLQRLLRDLGLSLEQGGRASPARMLLAGFSPWDEPFLRQKVANILKNELEKLGSGKVRVPGSLYLTGIPDPTGTLKENEVVVLAEGRYCEERVLVYRSPGTHAGDVQPSESVVPTAELRQLLRGAAPHMQNAIIFSIQGPRSLADKLSGGDMDGDEFVVLRPVKIDPGNGREPCSLVEAFVRTSAPWSPPPPPSRNDAAASSAPARIEDRAVVGRAAEHKSTDAMLIQHYHDCDETQGMIGRIANTINLALEEWTAVDPRINTLVTLYNMALDAGKNGTKIDATEADRLRVELELLGFPRTILLSKKKEKLGYKEKPRNAVESALCLMYDNAKSGCAQMLQRAEESPQDSLDVDLQIDLVKCSACCKGFSCKAAVDEHMNVCVLLQSMDCEISASGRAEIAHLQVGDSGEWTIEKQAMWQKWTELHKLYLQQKREMDHTEREKQQDGARQQQQQQQAAADGWSASYAALIEHYRNQLVSPYSEEEREQPCERLLVEASVVYAVSYVNRRALAFVWHVAGPFLCFIKARAVQHRESPGQPLRLASDAVLRRLVALNKGRAGGPASTLPDSIDGEEGPAAHEQGANDDGIVSTPWTRCG